MKYFLILLGLMMSSCCSWRSKDYNVNLRLDQTLSDASVEVNIIGITPANKAFWSNLSVDHYFGGPKQKNAKDKYVVKFKRDSALHSLEITDEIWATWSKTGVTHLGIIASIPGLRANERGAADPRMLIIPISYCYWGRRSLEVLIQDSGVLMMTPMTDYQE